MGRAVSGQGQFGARTEALWRRHLPLVRERLELIASAGDKARAGTLTDGLRAQARQAAHQLAGVLDTYGRAGGSALAGAAEKLLADAPPGALADGLGKAVPQLRALVEHSPSGPDP
jgi:hypothetical protein